MIYCILIFSFLFEAAFSNLISNSSILTPLFLITSLVILYPYFKNKNANFVIVCIVLGLFYDIIFGNTTFINTLSFGILSGITILGYNYINYNIYSSNLLNIIVLVLYRIISYLLLCIVDYISFNENILLEGIYNSILVNLIYGILLYLITIWLSKIFNIKRVE